MPVISNHCLLYLYILTDQVLRKKLLKFETPKTFFGYKHLCYYVLWLLSFCNELQ